MDNEHPRARLYYLFGAHQNPHGTPWLARLPAGLFAIPVGLFGLVGAWRRAAAFGLHLADIIDTILAWPVAAIWMLTVALYAVKCKRHPQAVLREFRHPIQGSLMALAPLSALLAVINLGHAGQVAWLVVTVLALAAHAVLAVRVVSQLATGQFPVNAITPALYLPLAGGSLVGAMALSFLGYTGGGMLLFGVGIAGWVMLEIRVMRRMFEEPMPESVRPTIGVELAPPVIATLAAAIIWPTLPADALLIGLGCAAVPFATVLARYRWWAEMPFSIGFWSFSFPLAALASVALETVHRGGGPMWLGTAVLAFASAIILGLLVRTAGLLVQGSLLPPE
jgi:tellurite resistance protein